MNSPHDHNPWIHPLSPARPQAAMRLFCIPYAGGGPLAFRGWADLLPDAIDVHAVQLPGRGTRLREKPFTRLEALIAALAQALEPWLDRPFAIYGHSLGALIAFELIRTLRRGGLHPARLFVSGQIAPHRPDPNPKIHHEPDPVFLKEMNLLGGTPREVMECAELMQLLLPALRADFAVLETYEHQPQPPLACPITAFGGRDDPRVSRADLEAWRELTHAECRLVMLPGDHFFIGPQKRTVLTLMGDQLRECMAAAGEASGEQGKVYA